MCYRGRFTTLLVAYVIIILWDASYFLIDRYAAYSYFFEKGEIRLDITFLIVITPFLWWMGKQYDKARFLATELQTSKEQLKGIVEQNADAIIVLDLDGHVLKVNDSFEKMYGWSSYEILGKNIYEFVVESEALIQKTKTKGRISNFEAIRFKKDGSPFYVSITLSLLQDTSGKNMGIVGIIRDITRKKQAEESLRESEERYRRLIHLSPDAIAVYCDGKYVFINKKGLELLGAENAEEIIDRSIYDFLHPDYHLCLSRRVRQMYEKKTEAVLSEEKMIRVDGQIIDVEIASIPITYKNRPAIQVIMRNITERKQLEQALHKSNELFQAIFEKAGIGIVLRDSKNKIIKINPTFSNMLGYSKEEFQEIHFSDLCHPDDLVEDMKYCNELIEGRRDSFQMVKRFVRQDGQWMYGNLTVSLLPDINDESLYSIGMIQDITEQKRAQDKLREREKQLSMLINVMPDFVCFKDGEGRWLEANQYALSVFRLDGISYQGKTDPELAEYTPDFKDVLLACVYTDEQIWKYKETQRIEEIVPQPDGTICVFDVIKSPVFYPDGSRRGLLVIGRDITERKVAEQKLMEANKRLQQLSFLDGLTGIANRRYFDELLQREWKRAIRQRLPLSLIILDIDFFKEFNDTYGHQGGDDCLKKVAGALEKVLRRSSDILARYGGEEFTIILPETDSKGAFVVAENLRLTVEALKILHESSKVSDFVTISIGVATVAPADSDLNPEDLIAMADKVLYQAKQEGRNVVKMVE